MSQSFGVEDLEEHIRNVLTTDFVRKTTPVSTLIVAPPERNKSNTVAKFRGEKILTLNDLTAYDLIKEIEQHTKNGKCQYSHIVIPDLTRITSRSKTVRKEVVSTLQILAAEGMQEIHTYNVNLSFKEPLKIGVIACITRLDLCDHRSVWSKIGFLSRFIPFSFDYDEQLKVDILKFISEDRQLKQETIRIKKRKIAHVTIPSEIGMLLQNDARRMAFNIEQFCKTPPEDRVFGARALNQLSAYLKAIALRNDETTVNKEHYEQLGHLSHYFNYSCPLILPRKVEPLLV